MNLPRWIHRLYARAFGYFWLDCPICGRMFGGHEKHGEGIPNPKWPRLHLITCPTCPPHNPTPKGTP